MFSLTFHKSEKDQIFYKDKDKAVAWFELQIGNFTANMLCVYYGKNFNIHYKEKFSYLLDDLSEYILDWLQAITKLNENNNICYLLYEYDDQSTNWIKCELHGDILEMQAGWSTLDGIGYDALYDAKKFRRPDLEELKSNNKFAVTSVPDFNPISEKFIFERKVIVAQMENIKF